MNHDRTNDAEILAVHQARLSASLSSANVAASIAPDLTTLSRNGLIAAANEAMRVQKSLEHEVAALQQTNDLPTMLLLDILK